MSEYRVGFEAISHLSIEDLSQPFYELFDGVLAERAGRISVFVYVTGDPVDAACHAVKQLEEVGFSVVRTDADLVDGPEAAKRLTVSRQAVQNWAVGDRGSSFPHPVGVVNGKRIWAWAQIVEWYKRDHELDEPDGLSLDESAFVDAILASRRADVASRSLRVDWAIGRGSMKPQAGLPGTDDYDGKKLSVENAL